MFRLPFPVHFEMETKVVSGWNRGHDSEISFLIRYLNTLGMFSIRYRKDFEGKKQYAVTSWASPLTWGRVMCALIFSISLLLFATHMALKIFFVFGPELASNFKRFEEGSVINGKSTTFSASHGLRLLSVLVSTCQFSIIVASWLSSSKLVEWLNNWNDVADLLKPAFDEAFLRRIHKVVCRPFLCSLSVRGVVPIILVLLGALPVINSHSLFYLEFGIMLCLFLQMISVTAGLDDLNITIMNSLKDGYAWVRESLNCCAERNNVTAEKLALLRQLTCEISRQCHLAGEFLTPMLIIFILNTVASGTLSGFMILKGNHYGAQGAYVKILIIVLFLALLARLFKKARGSEAVLLEVQAIGNDIMRLDSVTFDPATFGQVQLLYGLVSQNDTGKINIGNLGTLNGRLFLGIFSQVVAYLIVVMQVF